MFRPLALLCCLLAVPVRGQAVFATGLDEPHGIVQLADGRVLVAEFGVADRVSAFGADGTRLGTFAEGLDDPTGIAQLADGRVLVTEFNDGRVQAFTSDGAPLGPFVAEFNPGSNGLPGAPLAIAQASNGDVLITDNHAGEVLAYPAGGGSARVFASSLTDPPGNARGVVRLSTGSVLVTFTGPLEAFQVFGPAGGSGSVFAETAEGEAGQMVQLPDGRIFVLDWFFGTVRAYSAQGAYLGAVATVPDVLGGIAVLADGRVLVTGIGGTIYEVGVSTAAETAPETAPVARVQPNPSPGPATVVLAPRTSGPATVEVFDRLGRRVAQLYDGPLAAGEVRTLTLNTAGLAAGVYGIRVRTADGVEGHPLTLAR